ncbi:MAG: SMP-30/gluconolactonase/LRE family protein [Kiritimatiellia bacterium]
MAIGLPVVSSENPVDPNAEVERIASGFGFTEGAVADRDGNLYFTDIPNARIYLWAIENKLSLFREDSGHANGLGFDKEGNLLACEGARRRVTSTTPEGRIKVLCDEYNGRRFNSPNDLWVAPDGGIYFTDPRYSGAQWIWEERSSLTNRVDNPDDAEEQEVRGLYYLSPAGKPVWRCKTKFTNPNGVIGTADGKWLYVSDTEEKKVRRFAICKDGFLAEETVFVSSYSDGMTIDSRGNLYLTNGGIDIYSPEGRLIETIQVPEKSSNAGFGGSDRKTLFITAGKSVYAIRMKVQGQ